MKKILISLALLGSLQAVNAMEEATMEETAIEKAPVSMLDQQLLEKVNKAAFYTTIRDLVVAGADVNATYDNGDTLVMKAALIGMPEVLKLLLQNGADLDSKNNDGKNVFDLLKEKVKFAEEYPMHGVPPYKVIVDLLSQAKDAEQSGKPIFFDKVYNIEHIKKMAEERKKMNA